MYPDLFVILGEKVSSSVHFDEYFTMFITSKFVLLKQHVIQRYFSLKRQQKQNKIKRILSEM